ncbi:MAG: hypothetical protein K6B72_05130 [Lachnospiraceae bacterium]|nr:hypothetical protein [Lachnospiraceae bacterium]
MTDLILFPSDFFDTKKERFGRFMVKDYVKSVKGTEFLSYFGHDVTQETFDRWMEVFYKYRGGLQKLRAGKLYTGTACAADSEVQGARQPVLHGGLCRAR